MHTISQTKGFAITAYFKRSDTGKEKEPIKMYED